MELTSENLQSLLTDLSWFIQLVLAVIGSLLILLPLVYTLVLHHDWHFPLISVSRKLVRGCSSALRWTWIGHGTFYAVAPLIRPVSSILGLLWQLVFTVTGMSLLSSRDAGQHPNRFKSSISNSKASPTVNVCLSNIDPKATLITGLVNTGNSCFLNSVLQALSSLPRLQSYLDFVTQNNVQSLPLTRSLLKTLRLLTVPVRQQSSFRPTEIVNVMASSNTRVVNQEQQDAQELFQLISSSLDAETQTVEQTGLAGDGLKDVLRWSSFQKIVYPHPGGRPTVSHANSFSFFKGHLNILAENPFTGLLANRLSCMQCGYTEAIRHFSFNNVQLTLPQKSSTTLDECLEQLTAMEYLNDATCRKCSLIDTVRDLCSEVEALKDQASRCKDTKTKRSLLTKMVQKDKIRREIEHRLNVGRIEEEENEPFGKDKAIMLRTVSRMSSKQVMFAKPPKILCLHISRSAFHTSGVIYKNQCHISFPEYLDMSPYCTDGTLNTQPHMPISTLTSKNAAKYKLMSTVVHFGSHNFGHFIAYKRRMMPSHCSCRQCSSSNEPPELNTHDSWYRISDEEVDVCSLDDVLRANPYMLLYELVEDTAMAVDETSTQALAVAASLKEANPHTVLSGVDAVDDFQAMCDVTEEIAELQAVQRRRSLYDHDQCDPWIAKCHHPGRRTSLSSHDWMAKQSQVTPLAIY
ncbi:uncharacterized protein BYT42DRAFT_617674 [Radiomyces spectabilis]|uniref:uncharacterized protein n=1 Tax=Radiomyces spectabilis TaxID=64574 RepID=UPI0022206D01|nr:uncharacterized protein BYT42DRAFT_617674 [Radiomyces spectabilis]KAI8368119.1 hypothetical protein BYT42DRAFT_617674 [Radiomyces spectabilis]